MQKRKLLIILIAVLVIALTVLIILLLSKNSKELSLNNINDDNEQQNVENNELTEKYVTKLDKDGESVKLNNSNDFNKAKKYNNLEITNIQFTSEGNKSILLADVKNVGSEKHNEEIVEIAILGEEKEVIATLQALISDIEPGETNQLNVIVTADIVNAKDFTIRAK